MDATQSSFLGGPSSKRPTFELPKGEDIPRIKEIRNSSLDYFDVGVGRHGRVLEAFVCNSEDADLGVILIPEEWFIYDLSQTDGDEVLKKVDAPRAISQVRDRLKRDFLKSSGVYTIAFSMFDHRGNVVENYNELLLQIMSLGTDEVARGENGEMLMIVEVLGFEGEVNENISQRAR